MADQLLKELGITEGVTLQLNTLGDAETREAWRAALVAHFEAHRGELSEESVERLAKNPLRILDSKDPRDRPIADAAPGIDDFMTTAAQDFFAAVTAGLDAAGVAWTRDARLVRGLDYYRHTAFEFVTDRLGAHGTILGGGRYDGLVESFGGPHTPAVGWAAGIERLAMMIEAPAPAPLGIVVIPISTEAEPMAMEVLARLRRYGAPADMAFRGNLKRRLAKADNQGAIYVAIIGEEEIAGQTIKVKILSTGAQHQLHISKLEALAFHARDAIETGVPDDYMFRQPGYEPPEGFVGNDEHWRPA
jgi:histidyl-tRNA synthetase